MTQIVKLHEFRTHVSRWLDRVSHGEELLLERRGGLVVRLTPAAVPAPAGSTPSTGGYGASSVCDSPLYEELLIRYAR